MALCMNRTLPPIHPYKLEEQEVSLVRGRVPGAGHSFFGSQAKSSIRVFWLFCSNCLQTSCGAVRNKALRASTLLEAVGVTRIFRMFITKNARRNISEKTYAGIFPEKLRIFLTNQSTTHHVEYSEYSNRTFPEKLQIFLTNQPTTHHVQY